MPREKFYRSSIISRWALPILLCLACFITPLAVAQSDTEAALRALTEKFFAAYQEKDLNRLKEMWSAKSPELAALQQSFATVEKIELKSVSIVKITVDGDKATVRVAAEMNAADSKTGKPLSGFGKMNRALHAVKEGGEWLIWRYVSSDDELAAALIAAKNDDEQKALLASEKVLNTVELQGALMSRGMSLANKGSYVQATSAFQLALNLAEQIDNKKGVATALRGLGVICSFQNLYSQASEFFQKSLKLAEELGDKQSIALALNNIGILHEMRSDYTQALEYSKRSLKLAKEIGNKSIIYNTMSSIGRLAENQGDHDQADEYFQQSLKIAEEMADKLAIARVLNNIGNVRKARGDYMQALQYYQQSLKLGEEINHRSIISQAQSNIGNIYRTQGNYAQALEYFQRGMKSKQELADKAGIANTLSHIGITHRLEGNYAKAIEYFQQSLKITEEIADKAGSAYTFNSLATVYYSQRNYAEALEYYQKFLKLSQETGDKRGISVALGNIASVYNMQGNYAQAVEMAQQSVAIANQIGNADIAWEPQATAGLAYHALRQFDKARQSFAEAISVVEKLRSQVAGGEQERQRFFENQVSPYYEMIDLLVDQNDAAEALAYAERAKGRVLLDVLGSGRVNVTKAMTSQEQQQERKLNGELVSLNAQIYNEKVRQQQDEPRLADLNARLQKARLQYEDFQTNLYAAHPELKAQRGEAQPLDLKDSANLIPDSSTALLEFAITENKTYLFVLTKGKAGAQAAADLRVYTLNIKQKELADRAQRFRKRLAGLDVSFADLATSLYDLLLKPAQAQLRMKTALVIVPDGVLWELPFQALMPTRNRYLIEDCAIDYAPSLTVLREMVKLRRTRTPVAKNAPTLLAFGNPALSKQAHERVETALMGEKLVPLPQAELQVKFLARLYGAAQSQVYIGAEAREDRAKAEAGKYRILHLATHGLLNDASPMYSQVVLSQSVDDPNNDGLLEAWEIMNLDLKAELVILSACETARGHVGAGEGLIGLSWALFVAGCPTTVVSQWKVESAGTTELMSEFHRRLKPAVENPESKITKAEALRQAALKLLRSKKYNHPFYWAAFVVIGDGR